MVEQVDHPITCLSLLVFQLVFAARELSSWTRTKIATGTDAVAGQAVQPEAAWTSEESSLR